MVNLSIPKRIEEELKKASVNYQVVDNILCKDICDKNAHAESQIRSVGFKYESQIYLAILPYHYLLDFRALSDQLGFQPTLIEKNDLSSIFKGCKGKSFPPISGLYGIKLVIDPIILDMDEIYIESGTPDKLLLLDKIAGNLLFQDCQSSSFAVGTERLFAGRNQDNQGEDVELGFTSIRLKQRIDETFDLPAMPDIAQDIMKLRVDPSADAAKLAVIVSRDPSLAAQVISWASSPYYGYQGKIDSIETAIARVLGFELVMNLALGLSIGKSLKVPKDGPLGVREFWKQSIYTATLAEKLSRAMPLKQRPERGLIYLSGLLHNFGHLLLGHIFPPQFELINNTIIANPYIAVEDIEFYILGTTHEVIGAWLMQNWHMPDELIVAVHRHHQEEFWSKHGVYSNLVLVANRLLRKINVGGSIITNIPQSTLELLSLDDEAIEIALKDILMESESLDMMANQLVA